MLCSGNSMKQPASHTQGVFATCKPHSRMDWITAGTASETQGVKLRSHLSACECAANNQLTHHPFTHPKQSIHIVTPTTPSINTTPQSLSHTDHSSQASSVLNNLFSLSFPQSWQRLAAEMLNNKISYLVLLALCIPMWPSCLSVCLSIQLNLSCVLLPVCLLLSVRQFVCMFFFSAAVPVIYRLAPLSLAWSTSQANQDRNNSIATGGGGAECISLLTSSHRCLCHIVVMKTQTLARLFSWHYEWSAAILVGLLARQSGVSASTVQRVSIPITFFILYDTNVTFSECSSVCHLHVFKLNGGHHSWIE